MTRTEHLLVKLAEECAEVAQRATKALRFGLQEIQPGQELTNAARIVEELKDLFAAIEMLTDEGAISGWPYFKDVDARKARVEKYLAYSESLGLLVPKERKCNKGSVGYIVKHEGDTQCSVRGRRT